MTERVKGSRTPYNGIGFALRRWFGLTRETREQKEAGVEAQSHVTAAQAVKGLRKAARGQAESLDGKTGAERVSTAAAYLKSVSRSVTTAATKVEDPAAPVPQNFDEAMASLVERLRGL